MSNLNASQLNKALIGAALAGLSCFAPEAGAATVLTETTDFSNDVNAPTNLSSTFPNFLVGGGVAGQIDTFGDNIDTFELNVTPNTEVSIPWSVSSSSANNQYIYLSVFDDLGNYINGSSLETLESNTPFQSTLDFTTPASGKIRFGVSQEASSTTLNYTIGATVPEPTTGLLSLAGLAAAALRRRRESL